MRITLNGSDRTLVLRGLLELLYAYRNLKQKSSVAKMRRIYTEKIVAIRTLIQRIDIEYKGGKV